MGLRRRRRRGEADVREKEVSGVRKRECSRHRKVMCDEWAPLRASKRKRPISCVFSTAKNRKRGAAKLCQHGNVLSRTFSRIAAVLLPLVSLTAGARASAAHVYLCLGGFECVPKQNASISLSQIRIIIFIDRHRYVALKAVHTRRASGTEAEWSALHMCFSV